ncbi:MAG: hypothetical protein ACK56F_13480, partial [bacterium]
RKERAFELRGVQGDLPEDDREGPTKAKMAGKKEAKRKAGPSGQKEKQRKEAERSERTKNTSEELEAPALKSSLEEHRIVDVQKPVPGPSKPGEPQEEPRTPSS